MWECTYKKLKNEKKIFLQTYLIELLEELSTVINSIKIWFKN